jgi:hypothetical protein
MVEALRPKVISPQLLDATMIGLLFFNEIATGTQPQANPSQLCCTIHMFSWSFFMSLLEELDSHPQSNLLLCLLSAAELPPDADAFNDEFSNAQ